MKIVIGSDHAGFFLKDFLRNELIAQGHHLEDMGTYYPVNADYPEFAYKVSNFIVEHNDHVGILICGTGQGMAMAANRHPDIRAALCLTKEYATLARAHNNANVLCMGARFVSNDEALAIVNIFLTTSYEGNAACGARHARRVALLSPTATDKTKC